MRRAPVGAWQRRPPDLHAPVCAVRGDEMTERFAVWLAR